MPRTYDRWITRANPPLGFLTNNFVNYYEGVSITQNVASSLHTLPDSFNGKKFHINNEGFSIFDVLVQVNTQNGLEQFDIAPGDSGVFVYTGNGIWDQIGGETVITQVGGGGGGPAVSNQDQFNRTITFSDPPDSGFATYNLGTVPAGFSVSDVAIDVSTPFNDTVCDNVRVEAVAGPTLLMGPLESDIRQVGNFAITYPAATSPIAGQVRAIFNSAPNGAGGSAGSLTIIVEFQAV